MQSIDAEEVMIFIVYVLGLLTGMAFARRSENSMGSSTGTTARVEAQESYRNASNSRGTELPRR